MYAKTWSQINWFKKNPTKFEIKHSMLPTKIYIIEVVVELSAWKWKSNQAENVSTLTILLKKPNHTETGGFYNMIFPSKYEPIKSFWSIFRLYLIRCTIVELL